jgi:sialidase-1
LVPSININTTVDPITSESITIGNSHFIYSDDHGISWNLGHVFNDSTNECLSAELSNGSVITIFRQNVEKETQNSIFVSYSNDFGINSTPAIPNDDLITPVCQASIIDYSFNGTESLILCNPASENRFRMSLKVSTDNGITWNIEKLLFSGRSIYSDLTILEDGTIGCLFERGNRHTYEKITFVTFTYDWILH